MPSTSVYRFDKIFYAVSERYGKVAAVILVPLILAIAIFGGQA